MKIRRGILTDAPIIAEYNVALAMESERLSLDPARVRHGVEALCRDAAKGLYFVADEGGRLMGQLMVTYEWSDWRNGNFWWLQSVYVHPDFRERGVFKSLLAHVIELARSEKDVCGFRLYVDNENTPARQAYRRLGFAVNDYQVMSLDLTAPPPNVQGPAGGLS